MSNAAGVYITWSQKSPWRIAADVRWTFFSGAMWPATPFFRLEQGCCWYYLKRWLEAYYHGDCLGLKSTEIPAENNLRWIFLITAARYFELVRWMRDYHGLYWPQIRTLLAMAYHNQEPDTKIWREAYYMRPTKFRLSSDVFLMT